MKNKKSKKFTQKPLLSKQNILICSICLCILISIIMIIIFDKDLNIDEAIYKFIINFRNSHLDKYFTTITHCGDTIFIIGLVLAFILISRNIYGMFIAISAINSALLTFILKQIFLRQRPEHLKLITQGGYSFPSGHAMISICVYGYLLHLVLQIKNKYLKYTLTVLLITLIISIGLSRIYVGVHYPTDVIAGYSVGIIEVVLLTKLLHLYKNRGN